MENGLSTFSPLGTSLAIFTRDKGGNVSKFSPKPLHPFSSFTSRKLLGLPSLLRRENSQLFTVAVLPEQFHNAPTQAYRDSGEAALMRAILNDAIGCFQKHSNAIGVRSRRLAKETEDWLFSDEEEWIFSFINICFVLGLDPTALRDKLHNSLRQPPQSPQRKRHIATRRRYLHHIARRA